MLLDSIIGVVVWLVESSINAVVIVIPASVISTAAGFATGGAFVFKAGPVTTLAIMFIAYSVIDIGIGAFIFGINAYKLIPFKAS